MARSLLCKILQKRTYDILSHKRYLVLCFVGLVVVTVSAFRFGERAFEWSKEKYAAVFNSFSDNIAGRSFQSMLCQYVPIDVVYTWVNGTDPRLLRDLIEIRERFASKLKHSNEEQCPYSYCVASHMALVKPALSTAITLSDLEESDPSLENITRIFIVNSLIGDTRNNITVLVFSDYESAINAVKKQYFTIHGFNYSIKPAYITEDWTAQNTAMLGDVLMMTGVHSRYSKQDIIAKLPSGLQKYIQQIYLHKEKSLAILTVLNKEAQEKVLQFEHNITFDGKAIKLNAANLVIQYPTGNEDISPSRFADNEELRYSLRSLEKHAPWVHHIYIVTNGQIPYWLNLDNPRVSIITHEELFPNKSHLPTFSSPAIETHLHRIPGLTKKFLYLNDDVMFGQNIWPQDFYTHTKGQKVYLSWPVPDCAEGCPPTWIRDGYCDKPCNNSECQWDGGDCVGDKVQVAYPNHLGNYDTHRQGNPLEDFDKEVCSQNCINTWLADRYCDQACNVHSCAFDVGDCGTSNYHQLYGLTLLENQQFYTAPQGELYIYLNLSSFFGNNGKITEGAYESSQVVRVMAISLKYQVLTLVLYPNHSVVNLTITLKRERKEQSFEHSFQLRVNTVPLPITKKTTLYPLSRSEHATTIKFEEFADELRQPKILLKEKFAYNSSVHNTSVAELPKEISKSIKELDNLLLNGLITEKGYQQKKQKLISMFLRSSNSSIQNGPQSYSHTLSEKNQTSNKKAWSKVMSALSVQKTVPSSKQPSSSIHLRKLKGLDPPDVEHLMVQSGKFPWEKQNIFSKLQQIEKEKEMIDSYKVSSLKNRRLLDTFGDSLRHVNKLFNEAFGYETRKVPAHIAHFIDVDVMNRVQARFVEQFDITSSHQIRSSTDMQFAFSYYYFLISEMEEVEMMELFDKFDTDHSGTWSDREIRTVLTRLHDLPLEYSSVHEFENHIINCSKNLQVTNSVPTPPYERYYDSNLPTVSKELILACPPVIDMLKKCFGKRKRNKVELLGEEDVAFKMIHTNLSQVLGQLDDVRKNPKKFICLNDNIKHGTKDAEIIQAVLQDFYESLFPVRSQFELPPDYRNRFLHMEELREWQKFRDLIRFATYLCLTMLILFSVASFCSSEVCTSSNYSIRNFHRRSNTFDV